MTPEEIKALREYLGLSQGDFARLLGVEQVTVNSWEAGKHTPQISWDSRLKALCERREAVRKQLS
ncbi:MAG: helix-turn-helix domain-containing protein [Chloroflexi bacterium]|nr:helix-turn-helix domain-containing protein [Chloroflexota bacterium]